MFRNNNKKPQIYNVITYFTLAVFENKNKIFYHQLA